MQILKKVLPLIISTLFLLVSCKKDDNPIEPVVQEPEFIIPKTTKLLPDSIMSENLLSVSQDSTIFYFKKGNSNIENLKVNDIIVSDIDQGMLRKVNSVSSSGNQITISTGSATITEAIQKGKGNITKTLTQSDIASVQYEVSGLRLLSKTTSGLEFSYEFNNVILYDHDNNPSTTNDQVILDGEVGISPSFTLSLEIEDWKLKELVISQTFSEDVKIKCKYLLKEYSINKKIEIARYQLTPITFFIGLIPVVITPHLSFNIGVDGSVSATIESSIEQSASLTGGLTYSNNSWSPIVNESHSFNWQPPTFGAEAKAKAYVGPQLNFLLYGVIGPYAELNLFGELEVEVLPNPKAALHAGIQLGIGVKFEILDKQIVDFYQPSILELRVKIWEQNNFGGKIGGLVKDAVTNVPLSNVKIVAFKNGIEVDSAFSNSEGIYELSLPVFDNYKIVFTKPGYIVTEHLNVNVSLLLTTTLETILQIDQTYSGTGTIEGKIKNALTGIGVSSLQLKLRKGINAFSGNIFAATNTDNSGDYIFEGVEVGNYTIEASGSGYNNIYFSVICLGGQTVANQDATITPNLAVGETRIILTWGETPVDLDSHFTGPLADGTRFHMYYRYKGNNTPWPNVVSLDLDDVTSYGPETTTLLQQIDGVYRFSVHDFTNREHSFSKELSNSNAQVRVYNSEGLVASFNIPPDTEGTLWTVFEMNNTTISPINTFSYIINPGDINRPGEEVKGELESFPIK